MSDFNYLKLYSFGQLTLSTRVQPVDKISPTVLNLIKEPEYEVSINVIDAIDHFIAEGLKNSPTMRHFDELIVLAYQQYRYPIASKLDIRSELQFKEFCQKRYHNEKNKVRIAGIVIELRGIDFLG